MIRKNLDANWVIRENRTIMKRFHFFTIIFIFIIIGIAQAQSYQKADTGIQCIIDSLHIEIQFYNPNIVRLFKHPGDITVEKKSLSVIKIPQKTDFNIKQDGDLISLRSKKIEIEIDLKTGMIVFSKTNGELLLTEKENGTSFNSFIDVKNETFNVKQSFVLENDEAIYWQSFTLDAFDTTDPDGDSYSVLWFHYPETGSYNKEIKINGAENVHKAFVTAPDVNKKETAHIILKVTDGGTPQLSRYKRVILNIILD